MEAITDSLGRYSVLVPDGYFVEQIVAWADGRPPTVSRVGPECDPTTLGPGGRFPMDCRILPRHLLFPGQLDGAGRCDVVGRVAWRGDQSPVAGGRVRWTESEAWLRTQQDGSFRIPDVPEGLRLFETRVLGTNDVFRIVPVQCPAGGDVFEVELDLRRDIGR